MAKGQDMNLAKMSWRNRIDLTFFTLIIQTLTCCSNCAPNNGEVFIQTNNELRFMIDGIPLPISSADSLIFSEEKGTYDRQDNRLPIIFTPPTLDFDTQPVGMPSLRRITVTNRHHRDNIHLLSISGSTPHFHCSFFKDKVLYAGKNTTFDVVFLARQVGNVEHALKIQTDRGVFMYHVFGVGVNNAFRLKPLLGARVPVNGSYSPVITMHNPFSKALRVVEMFSSGGNLHLELPTGAAEATQNMWEILPFETKPLIRATYLANTATNDTGYIRIRTKSKQGKDDLLILPLEVEVSEHPGLYSPQHILDFGVLHSGSGPKSLPLFVINSSIKPVEIMDVFLESANEAISIEFMTSPTIIEGNVESMSVVANITYYLPPDSKFHLHRGNIIIIGKDGQRLVVPYIAEVQQGTLQLETLNSLTVHTSEMEQVSDLVKPLFLQNTFATPVVVYNITVPADSNWVKTSVMNQHIVIPGNSVIELTKLTINSAVKRLQGSLSTHIHIHSNVSVFRIPIHVYDGTLQMVFQHNSKELDFGSLGFSESRELYFTLRNNNPINVTIKDLYSTSTVTQVELFGVEEGNGITLTRPPDWSKIQKDPLILPPNHFAVYKVKLTAPKSDGNYLVDVRVATDFDTFYVPVRFRTTEGSVKSIPEKIVFDKAFPTKVPFKILKIRSSFAHYTEVTKVSFLPEDSRFRYEPTKNTPTVLEPFQDTVIGHLYFDANNGSLSDSYAGLPFNSPGGLNWLSALTLAPGSDQVDSYLYTMFRSRWLALQHRTIVNVTVQVDTEWIQNFLFPSQAHLVWPSMLQNGNRLRFQPTHIGNLSSSSVVVENPSHSAVTIQILPLSLYPNPQTMVDLLMKGSDMSRLRSLINHEEMAVFTLQNLEKYNTKSENPIPAYREAIRDSYGVMPHMESISTTLLPGVRVSVLIGFRPKVAKSYVSLILIRNNLTVVGALIVSGKGATSNLYIKEEMSYEGEEEGGLGILLYEVKENSLKSCSRSSKGAAGKDADILTESATYGLRNRITLHNNGSLPVYVHGFDIEGVPCSHKSFQVLNCSGFVLSANRSKVVELVYYPDFSVAHVQTVLTIHASGNLTHNVSVSLHIPPRLLSRCRQSLPRPHWEQTLHWGAIVAMCLMLVITLLLSYVDMRKVFSTTLTNRAKAEVNVFDLRKAVEDHTARHNGGPNYNNNQEVRRRNRNNELLLNNGAPTRPQSNTDTLRIQAEKRSNQNGIRVMQLPQLSQGDANNSRTPDTTKKQTNIKGTKGSPTTSTGAGKNTAKLNNNTAAAAAKQNRNTSTISTPTEKVTNDLSNGGGTQLRQVTQGTSSSSGSSRPDVEEVQADNKHNHRNNLLKVDISTTISATSTDMANQSDPVIPPGVDAFKEGEGDGGVEQDSDLSMLMLSEEARAKLQQNSRAQLKKQQKKSTQAKLKIRKATAPAMVTKSVGTGDLEDCTSASTDSGSSTMHDGKSKHVTDWLTKLPDKSSARWNLPSPAHFGNGVNSDKCSMTSETPSWDTVAPDNADDFSDLADQAKNFAEAMDMGRDVVSSAPSTTKVYEPIGTRPQRNRLPAAPSWDFPTAQTVLMPSPSESPLLTPRAPIGLIPLRSDPLTQSNGHTENGQLLKRLQAERKLQMAEYNARRRSLGQGPLSDWSDLLSGSDSDSVWNTSQDWTPSIRSTTPSSVWDTHWSPWSETSTYQSSNELASSLQPTNGMASSLQPTNGVTSSYQPVHGMASSFQSTNGIAGSYNSGSYQPSSNLSQPAGTRQMNTGNFYSYIPDVWSPAVSTAPTGMGSSTLWNFEQPLDGGEGSKEK